MICRDRVNLVYINILNIYGIITPQNPPQNHGPFFCYKMSCKKLMKIDKELRVLPTDQEKNKVLEKYFWKIRMRFFQAKNHEKLDFLGPENQYLRTLMIC